MKKQHFHDIIKRSCMYPLCAVILCGLSLSCSKEDVPDNDDNHRNRAVKIFDDLVYFQDVFVEVDSVGDFLYRSVGVPLSMLDSDTTHLFVGVSNIEKAVKFFEMSLAPDIARMPSPTHNYTYTLTDVNGQVQGTVTFAPGTEPGHVAELTTTLPGLKHFSRVTYLDNTAWPLAGNSGTYRLGDEREVSFTLDYYVDSYRKTADYSQKFVCVREKSNGVKPLYVGTTDAEHPGNDIRIPSKWCPAIGNANMIANLIKSDFDFFKACFDAAGVPLNAGELYWFDDSRNYVLYDGQGCITLDKGTVDYWDIVWHSPTKRILMKIDWEDD